MIKMLEQDIKKYHDLLETRNIIFPLLTEEDEVDKNLKLYNSIYEIICSLSKLEKFLKEKIKK